MLCSAFWMNRLGETEYPNGELQPDRLESLQEAAEQTSLKKQWKKKKKIFIFLGFRRAQCGVFQPGKHRELQHQKAERTVSTKMCCCSQNSTLISLILQLWLLTLIKHSYRKPFDTFTSKTKRDSSSSCRSWTGPKEKPLFSCRLVRAFLIIAISYNRKRAKHTYLEFSSS